MKAFSLLSSIPCRQAAVIDDKWVGYKKAGTTTSKPLCVSLGGETGTACRLICAPSQMASVFDSAPAHPQRSQVYISSLLCKGIQQGDGALMLLEGSFLHIHSRQRALAGVHGLEDPAALGSPETEFEGHLAHFISLFKSHLHFMCGWLEAAGAWHTELHLWRGVWSSVGSQCLHPTSGHDSGLTSKRNSMCQARGNCVPLLP